MSLFPSWVVAGTAAAFDREFPPTACQPCTNGYHEACDGGAWGHSDRLFPTVCSCWAETNHQGDHR